MRRFLTVVLCSLALLAAADLAYFMANEERYVFGTEVGGWQYGSRANYLFANLTVIGAAVAALAVAFWRSRRNRRGD